MRFDQLGLSEQILKSLNEQDYKTPTAIQEKAIPAVLNNKDVMAAAQTGTGKTAGFTLPILDRLSKGEPVKPGHIRALVLTPTRELAAQVADSIRTYGQYLTVSSAVVFGGVKINPQIGRLRKGVDILVATPGRLLDLYQQKAVNFSQVEVLVLDEADRMLDMGFIHDIKKIISGLPKKRQNLMFSATFSSDIRELAKGLMNNAVEISVTPPNTTVNAIKQWAHPVDKKNKNKLLSHLIWEGKWEQVLVFARTKHGANRLADYLCEDGMTAVAIHGNKSQGARTRALADFKNGEARVLVATDIAARGLDIELLPHVVNFDLPQVPEDYIHRIGRTGRAGATGEAITLVSADEFRLLADVERLIKQKLPRKIVEGFEPMHEVPELNAEAPRRARSNQPRRDDSRYESRDRPRRPESSDRSERPARSDRADMPRIQKAERFERVSKKEWPPRKDGFKKSDRPARDDRFPRSDRSEKPARFDRTEKKEWAPRTDRFEKSDRPVKKEWVPRGEYTAAPRGNREEKKEWTPRGEKPARFERKEKKEWAPRSERIAKPWEPKKDSKDRPVRADRPRNFAHAERAEKKEWAPRAERPARFERTSANKESSSRGDRSERPARTSDERPARKEWTPRDDRSENKRFSSDRPTRSDRPVRSSEGRGGASGRPGGARPAGRSTTGPRKPSGPRRPSR